MNTLETPLTEQCDLANEQLADANPTQIIEWALDAAQRPLMTTSFGPHAGVLLDAVLSIDAKVPVLWVDHGFNTNATYRFAKELMKRYNPVMHIYSPKQSSAWILAQLGGMPDLDDPQHALFARQVKLEPFDRALMELKPDLWLAGIRRDETAHRAKLSVVTEARENLIRVAPFFNHTEEQMDGYLSSRELPAEDNYFDPTKGLANRECGIHAPR